MRSARMNLVTFSIVILAVMIGCDQKTSNPVTSDIEKKSEAFQDLGTDEAKKAAEYIKETGHNVCYKPLGYVEHNKFKYHRTIGDYRRLNPDEVPHDVPDETELCYVGFDCETGEEVKGTRLTVRQLETLGLLH